MKKRNNASGLPALGRKNWLIIIMLGTCGQLAWSIENSWFNTFVYDEITTDPRPIAVMVAASALVATLTTLIMGTLSDKVGKRKPFIMLGYILWGLSTALFPMAKLASTVFAQAALVVILDCVMTFFGSTAYDSNFNAWTTDISNSSNRGIITGVLQICPLVAAILLAGAGAIIDHFGYTAFFVGIGAVVLVAGLFGGMAMKDSPDLKPNTESSSKGFFKTLFSAFTKESYQKNKNLWYLMYVICLIMIAFQVSYSYETIYLNNYLNLSKTVISLANLPLLPVAIVISIVSGKLCDQGKGPQCLLAAPGMFALGAFLYCGAKGLVSVIIAKIFLNGGLALATVVFTALFKNYQPDENRGQFEGVRMIFMVLLPMVIGPQIGAWMINSTGMTKVVDGVSSLIPTPSIYLATGIVALIAYLAVFRFLKSTKAAAAAEEQQKQS